MGFLFTLLDFQKQGTTTNSLTLYRICHNSVRAPPFPFAKENNILVLKFPPPVDTTNSEEEAKKKKIICIASHQNQENVYMLVMNLTPLKCSSIKHLQLIINGDLCLFFVVVVVTFVKKKKIHHNEH